MANRLSIDTCIDMFFSKRNERMKISANKLDDN